VTTARGGALNIAGGISQGLLRFAFAVLITRAAGVRGAGIFFEVLALNQILSSLIVLGTSNGVVRFLPRCRALGRTRDIPLVLAVALVPEIALGTVVGAALFVAAPDVARILIHDADRGDAVVFLRMLAPIVPIMAVSATVLSSTRALGTMAASVVVDRIGKPMIMLALGLCVLTWTTRPLAISLVWGIPMLLGLAVAVVWLARLVKKAMQPPTDVERRAVGDVAREFWSFSAPRSLANLFENTVLWLDVLLIGALRSTRDAAIYSGATRYLAVGMVILTGTVLVVGPQFSGLFATHTYGRAQELYRVSTLWLGTVAVPAYVVLGVFAPVFMSAYGKAFVEGDVALTILAASMAFSMITGPVNTILIVAGKSSWNLGNAFAGLAVNVGLNLWLIPPLGAKGAAIAWAASIILTNVLALVQIWRAFGLQPFGFPLLRVIVYALVCFGVPGLLTRQVLDLTGLLPAFATVLLGAALYVALLWGHRDTLELGVLREALWLRRRGRGREVRGPVATGVR
jgi:O-antigen/teichoic acid export membrane protein